MAKILFDAVHVDHEVPKLGGHMGHAYAHTSYFGSAGHYRVELDTGAGLVFISHEKGGAIVVPRERVKRFEPLKEVPKAEEPAKSGK
jgi:hypothetical protein